MQSWMFIAPGIWLLLSSASYWALGDCQIQDGCLLSASLPVVLMLGYSTRIYAKACCCIHYSEHWRFFLSHIRSWVQETNGFVAATIDFLWVQFRKISRNSREKEGEIGDHHIIAWCKSSWWYQVFCSSDLSRDIQSKSVPYGQYMDDHQCLFNALFLNMGNDLWWWVMRSGVFRCCP